MKNRISYNPLHGILFLFVFSIPLLTNAQGESAEKSKRQSLLYLRYHVKNNQVPFLEVQTKNKVENAFLPAAKVPVTIYLDSDLAKDALVGQVTTDDKGGGMLVIPPSLAG